MQNLLRVSRLIPLALTLSVAACGKQKAATLKEAVRFMASGGAKNKNLTPLMRDQKLSEQELDEVVAFLGTLDCGKALEEPKLP